MDQITESPEPPGAARSSWLRRALTPVGAGRPSDGPSTPKQRQRAFQILFLSLMCLGIGQAGCRIEVDLLGKSRVHSHGRRARITRRAADGCVAAAAGQKRGSNPGEGKCRPHDAALTQAA